MPDVTVSQTALVVIAIAASIQSLLLVAGAWLAFRGWTDARVRLDLRLDLLQAPIDGLTEAAHHLVDTVEQGTKRISTIVARGSGWRVPSPVR